jgi:hypothetical protein
LGVAATSTPAAAWGNHPYWGWGAGGFAAGLALGAATSAAANPSYGYGYPACGIVRQPVVDEYGIVVGYHRVRVCN